MNIRTLTLFALTCAAASSPMAAATPLGHYAAIEVDRFVSGPDVAFPADYQSALVDEIGRETSLAFEGVIIVRAGQYAPTGYQVLRISGTVIRFKPGNRAKRYLIGFGAGATVVEAQVKFTDTATGQALLTREVKGVTWTGIAGGDSKSAGDSLARKIAKLCKSAHLVEAK
jgi:hypothetical protein